MSCMTMDGTQMRLPRAGRCEQPGPLQLRRRVHGIWLNCLEEGLYDPAVDRRVPHTTAELAEIWGVSIRTVQVGIAAAREVRDRIREIGSRA